MRIHAIRFPGETARYRTAGNRLLEAAMRRKLPLGAPVPEDYVFEEGATDLADASAVRRVKLSGLFRKGFMFSPEMKQACPMCTSFIDSLNGAARRRILGSAPTSRLRQNLPLDNRDYHGEAAEGGQMPSLNVFVRRGGKIHHFCNTELMFLLGDRGQNQRHNDMAWPVWNLRDFTPEGRGTDWFPQLSYKE